MSFNRLVYDKLAYKESVAESVNQGLYKTNMPVDNSNRCYPTNPRLRIQKRGDGIDHIDQLVDVSSELLGITRPATKASTKKFAPSCSSTPNCESGFPCGGGVVGASACDTARGAAPIYADRDCTIPTEDTRMSNPASNLRGTGWNRWEWLCKNPQDYPQQIIPFENNVPYRLVVKDNFRPVMPEPVNATNELSGK